MWGGVNNFYIVFGSFFILLVIVIFVFILLMKCIYFKKDLYMKDFLFLFFIGFLGGIIIVWFLVGVGELVVVYFII